MHIAEGVLSAPVLIAGLCDSLCHKESADRDTTAKSPAGAQCRRACGCGRHRRRIKAP